VVEPARLERRRQAGCRVDPVVNKEPQSVPRWGFYSREILPLARLVRNPGDHRLGPKQNSIYGNVFSELKKEISSFAGGGRSIDEMGDLVREARLVWFF